MEGKSHGGAGSTAEYEVFLRFSELPKESTF
jgi:hypothetical protein